MKTLLKNLTIIPMTESGLYFSGDIGIDDGKLAFVGKNDNFKADETKDCRLMIALPAFINGHTHLAMTLMRNYKDTSDNLQSWLSEIFPIEAKLTDKDIYAGSLTGLAELIHSGCATYADMYFNGWETVKATKEAGIRGVIGQTFFGDLEDTKSRLKNQLPLIDKAIDGDDHFRVDGAVHAIYTCSGETYSYVKAWAKERGALINTHLSETRKEVEDALNEFHMRPAEYLDSLGVFDVKCYLAHGVYLSDNELNIIRDHGASVIHNPASNCKLASGIAPIHHYREMGVNLALGTDGASSNNNLSMIKDINLAALLSTVNEMTPAASTPYQILEMATIGGAKALGLDDKIGTLEAGKEADIVLINKERANMSPLNDIFSAVVFSASEANVDSLYCKGKLVLEGGELQTLDEKEIIKLENECWEEIKAR